MPASFGSEPLEAALTLHADRPGDTIPPESYGHFGAHEFFDLVEQLGTRAYVCGNVGSGTVQEIMEWVEYMTSPAASLMANLRRQNGRDEP